MLNLSEDLLKKMTIAGFGLERECIRVDEQCRLSQKPHPECFGDKLIKKHITTDFSESQIEMITPVMASVDEMCEYSERLYDFVCSRIGDEYLWCRSMPCVIDGPIPVAQYKGKEGKEATEYREMLVERYGGEKQLISGIHFNFSLSDEFLLGLYEAGNKSTDFKRFTDEVYLKITRNYIRYGFLITFLCGCSNVCHKTYDKRCIATLEKKDENTFYAPKGVSLRNSKWGYRNNFDLFPSYNSAEDYVASIRQFISDGKISYSKEYYSELRLKGVKRELESLVDEGIKYIELRTVDINPFEKTGVAKDDLKFIHIFLLLMLLIDEDCDCSYQKAGQMAKETVSLYGIDNTVYVCGVEFNGKAKAVELINAVIDLNRKLGIYDEKILAKQLDKIENNGYSAKALKEDFIADGMARMKEFKKQAIANARAFSQEQIDELLE